MSRYGGNGGFSAVIFDLDNTLYTKGTGLFAAIDARITLYLCRKFGIGPAEAERIRARYRKAYHITLCGLMREDGVAPEEYLSFVHEVAVEDFLARDPVLDGLLGSIPLPKYIFTNGSREHARRVTAALSVERHFSGIFDIAFTGYTPKPDPEAYRRVLEALELEPRRVLYVDDLPANVAAASSLGMTTILLGGPAGGAADACSRARDLAELAPLLAGIAARGCSGVSEP